MRINIAHILTAAVCVCFCLLFACSAEPDWEDDEMGRAARRYVEAWCRGDDSVALEQFEVDTVPEPYRKWAQTLHELPTGSPVEYFEITSKGIGGAGKVPELLDHSFDMHEDFGAYGEQVVSVVVHFTVRLADNSEHRGAVAVRADVPFSEGKGHLVRPGDRWRALPLRQ